MIGRHGLFCALYTDRGSHYFHTPKAGEKVDPHRLTQVGPGAAPARHPGTSRPTAPKRGAARSGCFGTLQDRLVKELADAAITAIEAANRFLAEVYIPRHNARFAVDPEEPESAFMPYAGTAIEEVLCWQEDRVVGRDNTGTVRWPRAPAAARSGAPPLGARNGSGPPAMPTAEWPCSMDPGQSPDTTPTASS